MAIKLTKNELKKQKDNLKQFQRYLPTLQLKKQQLQSVIMGIRRELEEKGDREEAVFASSGVWRGGCRSIGRSVKGWKTGCPSGWRRWRNGPRRLPPGLNSPMRFAVMACTSSPN